MMHSEIMQCGKRSFVISVCGIRMRGETIIINPLDPNLELTIR